MKPLTVLLSFVLVTTSLATSANAVGTSGANDLGASATHSDATHSDFWNWGGWYPGNGDLAIYDGADTQAEDCIIWDIIDGGVHEGQSSSFNPPIISVSGPEIFGADGTARFIASWENGNLFKLRNTQGEVELTLWGLFIFDKEITDMPPFWSCSFRRLMRDHLVVTIVGNKLFAGKPIPRNFVGTSNEQLTLANPMRRLVLGALVHGVFSSD